MSDIISIVAWLFAMFWTWAWFVRSMRLAEQGQAKRAIILSNATIWPAAIFIIIAERLTS